MQTPRIADRFKAIDQYEALGTVQNQLNKIK
jgi:hypothetical protein